MKWINQKYLWVLVSVILLSMLGLISIQVYWIVNSYTIKENYFNYQVNKALSSTIKTLETHETIFEISNEVFQLAENKDSTVERSVRNFDQSVHKYKDNIHTIANKSTIVMSGDHVLKKDTTLNVKDDQNSEEENEAFLKISTSDVKNIIQNKVDNKTLFVEKIVNQLLNYNEDILERLNKVDLKALIDKSLKEYDINIQFEYAIKSDGERKFSTKPFTQESSKIYTKKLYPNNLFHDDDYLEIYIPGRTSFIVKTMLPVILITIILTFLIIGVVVFNFMIIVRQKKLGDIKNDFVNNLTHELKTPIATISLAGQMLSDKAIQSTETAIDRYAGIIREEAQRLTKQVEKVLQIALIDKGELKLNNKKFDLNLLIEKIVHPFVIKVENLDGEITVDLPDNPQWLFADELHIGNIINNLLDNALKYKLENPIIQLCIKETTDEVLIMVKDNGMGISKVDQLRIFEKFYRVEAGNVHNIKGFGLGLSYVKKIVELYRGTIEVKSKLKLGTTFTISLPKPDFTKHI